MQHELTCTCGIKHAIAVSQAGQTITCPCGNSLAIPTLRGLKELPVVHAAENPKARPIDRPTGGRPSIVTGILVAIFFIAQPTALFLGYLRLNLDTSQTMDNERAAAFRAFDEGDAILLSDTWDDYSNTALGPPTKPIFYYYQERRKQLEFGIMLAGSIAVLTGLAAGAISAGKRAR